MAFTKVTARKSTRHPTSVKINTEKLKAFVTDPRANKPLKVKQGYVAVDVICVDSSESDSDNEPTYTPSSPVPQANHVAQESPIADDFISLADLEQASRLSPDPVREPVSYGARGDPYSDDSGQSIHSPPRDLRPIVWGNAPNNGSHPTGFDESGCYYAKMPVRTKHGRGKQLRTGSRKRARHCLFVDDEAKEDNHRW